MRVAINLESFNESCQNKQLNRKKLYYSNSNYSIECSADQTRISKRENKKNKNILNQLSKIVQSSSIDFGEAPGEVRPG